MSKVVNPLTGRKIKVGGALHKRLCADASIQIAGCSEKTLQEKFWGRMMEIKDITLKQAKKLDKDQKLFKNKFEWCNERELFKYDKKRLEECLLHDPFDREYRSKDINKVIRLRERFVPRMRKAILKQQKKNKITEDEADELIDKFRLEGVRDPVRQINDAVWQPSRGRNIDIHREAVKGMRKKLKEFEGKKKPIKIRIKKKITKKKPIKIRIKKK